MERRELLKAGAAASAALLVPSRGSGDSVGSLDVITDESWRLVPDGGPRSFGMVPDLLEHIAERRDVQDRIAFWMSDGKDTFISAAIRFQFLENMIRSYTSEAGVPIQLSFACGVQESGFHTFGLSSAFARGLFQFIPSTGRKYDLVEPADFFDPDACSDAHARYMADLIGDFENNLELALTAYNSSRGYRYIRRRGDPNAFPTITSGLRWETVDYVPKILAAAMIGMEPERYNMHIPVVNIGTASIGVPQDLHYKLVAQLVGENHRNLANLNPSDSEHNWTEEGELFVLPQIYEVAFWDMLDDPSFPAIKTAIRSRHPAPGDEVIHELRRGEGLGDVAALYPQCGMTWKGIQRRNGISDSHVNRLPIGYEVKIPCSNQ